MFMPYMEMSSPLAHQLCFLVKTSFTVRKNDLETKLYNLPCQPMRCKETFRLRYHICNAQRRF